jgi:hypothetical protein
MHLLNRYHNFFSYLINLTLIIVVGVTIVALKNIETITLLKIMKSFGYCFSGVFVMCMLFALPYDMFLLRKDKFMCKQIEVDYELSFLPLEQKKKLLIRKKFNSLSQNIDKASIDWLSIE